MEIKPGLYYGSVDSEFNFKLIYILGYYKSSGWSEFNVYYYYDFFSNGRGNFCGEDCPFAKGLIPVTDEKNIKAAERTMAKKLADYKQDNSIYYEIDKFLENRDVMLNNHGLTNGEAI